MSIDVALLYVTLAAKVLITVLVVISIALPQRRIWPPPRPRSWEGTLTWLLFITSGAGTVCLGIVDWGGLALAPWIRFAVGAPLWCAGNVLALWAMAVLGIAPSFGEEGQLVRRGPYRFSRNPQYVGFMAALVGWAFVAGSGLTLVASLVGTIPLVLVPFAEEPWLATRLGAAYEEYRRSVPRFISLRKRKDDDLRSIN
jgi:protein-S-isoprenylcysteine O-methyltransferase Ste14